VGPQAAVSEQCMAMGELDARLRAESAELESQCMQLESTQVSLAYCQNGGKQLEESIREAEDKVTTLPEEIQAAAKKLTQPKDEIKIGG